VDAQLQWCRIGGAERHRDAERRNRDIVSSQYRGGFGRIQRIVTRRERVLDHPTSVRGIGGEEFRYIGRRFRQRNPTLSVTPALHESPDRVIGSVVARNAAFQKSLPGRVSALRTQPADQHARPSLAVVAQSVHDIDDRGDDRPGRNQRVRRVHYQHAVEIPFPQQNVQGGGEPGRIGIAAQIEWIVGRGAERQNPT